MTPGHRRTRQAGAARDMPSFMLIDGRQTHREGQVSGNRGTNL